LYRYTIVVTEVLKRITQAGLTIKASKCEFATAEVEYLGHTIDLGKVAPRGTQRKNPSPSKFFETDKQETHSSHSLA